MPISRPKAAAAERRPDAFCLEVGRSAWRTGQNQPSACQITAAVGSWMVEGRQNRGDEHAKAKLRTKHFLHETLKPNSHEPPCLAVGLSHRLAPRSTRG